MHRYFQLNMKTIKISNKAFYFIDAETLFACKPKGYKTAVHNQFNDSTTAFIINKLCH